MRGDNGSTSFTNRPAISFLAHRNGTDQSSVSSTATVTFTHTDFNVGGWFSTASGDFSPPAGKYELCVVVTTATAVPANALILAGILKDAAVHRYGQTAISPVSSTLRSMANVIVETTGTSAFKPLIVFSGTATGGVLGSEEDSYFWGVEITR